MNSEKSDSFGTREFHLTALWALNETALGGLLHALKIPVTGFFVGGFAVLIIGLLANGKQSWSIILRSMMVVLLIKAAASPHSPPMAYIAVAFQGISGALFYSLLPHRFASILFAVLAMVESCLQKLIMTTLIFGQRFWKALDSLAADVFNLFSWQPNVQISLWIVIAYTVVYATWGLILGIWILRLPAQIEKRKTLYQNLPLGDDIPEIQRKRHKLKIFALGWISLVLYTILMFITAREGQKWQQALFSILRALSVLLFLWLAVKPLLTYIIQRWLGKKKHQYSKTVNHILEFLPGWKGKIFPLYRFIGQQHKGIQKYREFVLALFVVFLYPPENE